MNEDVLKKVSIQYYLRYIAPRDPDTKRILNGYGKISLLTAIKEGRVETERGLVVVESLKNL